MNKTTFLKPFEIFNETQLLIFGTVVLLVGSYLSAFCHANFDGFFDLHFSNYQLSFKELLAQNLINISVLFICLFIVGKFRYKKLRSIDVLSTVLIARVPFYFLSLFNVNHILSVDSSMPIAKLMEFSMNNLVLLIFLFLAIIIIVIWMIALLYNGFKIATNAKGNTSLALFIVALLVSEVVSKLIIYQTIL